ncbi:MAG: GAF domain-containing protein [Hydrogenothermaceae bacterium]|nr:GAF domain-containing protein [Hydrogenothermaceae bacterium]
MEKEIIPFIESIFSQRDIFQILKNITIYTKDLVQAERVTLFLYNEEENILESIVVTGDNISKINVDINYSSIAGYTFLTNKVLNIKDVYDEEEIKSIHQDLRHDKRWDIQFKYRTKSLFSLPIVRGDRGLGVLQLINKKNQEQMFLQEDEKLVVALSKFIAIALEDGLTIYNLIHKEKEKKLIIESISEAITVTDAKLRIVDYNYSFLEMIGFRWDSESIVGIEITKILNEIGYVLLEKVQECREKSISSELLLNLLKVKIIPLITDEFGEKKLKKFVFIFRYPKG